MFRFGKHRKDGVAPTEEFSDIGRPHTEVNNSQKIGLPMTQSHVQQHQPPPQHINDRPIGGPPIYQPPPPVANGNSAIHHNDVFNHRYSHYVNYEELQQQIR